MKKNPIKIFLIAIIIVVVFLPSYTKMQDLKQKNKEYSQEIEALVKENNLLKEENRLLEEDPEYLEKVAREKMGLIREGEVIYRILPEDAK